MNKWLIGFLIFAILVLSGLAFYYFVVLNPNPTSSSLVQTFLPNLSGSSNASSDWQSVKKRIAPDCKEVSFATAQDANYISRLAEGIGGVTIDPTDDSFTTVDDTKQLSIQAVAKNGGIPVTGGVNCWTVWVGDAQGNGRVAYETINGEVKTLPVTGFPVTKPPAAPPAGE